MAFSHDRDHRSQEPAEFLKENVGLLPKGLVLDVAMGAGRNAVYLAQMGFQVEGVDISEESVQSALALAAQRGVNIHAKVGDLEKDYQIRPGDYDVVVCFNYLYRPLIPRIKTALRMGGMVVYETYIIDQPRFGHPHNPDFLLQYNELLEMFRDFRCLRYREGVFDNSRAIASIIAQKVDQG